MMFLAAFLGCMFAMFIYTESRSMIGAFIWRRKYGVAGLGVPGPADPTIGKMLDADHELRVAVLDLECDRLDQVSDAEAKVLRCARAWLESVPPDTKKSIRSLGTVTSI